MKIPVPIICVFLTAWLGLNGWEMKVIMDLKTEFAVFKATYPAKDVTDQANAARALSQN